MGSYVGQKCEESLMATKKKLPETSAVLPTWIYESLRYLSAILLPGIATLLSALNSVWNWGLPMDAILPTFVAVETFIGAVFLGSKLVTDAKS